MRSGLTTLGLVIDVFFVLDCFMMQSKPWTRSSLPSHDSLSLWLTHTADSAWCRQGLRYPVEAATLHRCIVAAAGGGEASVRSS